MASSTKTVAEVISFLKDDRTVQESVVDSFRTNKMDGSVISLLNDTQLYEIGLTAIGDQIALRHFCRGNPEETHADNSSRVKENRRKRLLDLIRGRSTSKNKKSTDSCESGHYIGGRPKSDVRSISLGMKVLTASGPVRKAKNVTRPLGDENYIKFPESVYADYDTLLEKASGKLFPNNNNPVIGPLADFTSLEIVNSHIQNVRDIPVPFTIKSYVETKMIAGSVRFFLLCTPLGLDTFDQDSDDSSLPDILPNISSAEVDLTFGDIEPPLNRNATFLPATPSGEVLLRVVSSEEKHTDQQDQVTPQPDTMDTSTQMTAQPAMSTSMPVEPGTTTPLLRSPISCEPGVENYNISHCVDMTLIQTIDSTDMIEILSLFSKMVLQGRPLEASEESLIEGETVAITVCRYNLLETTLEELIQNENYRYPLEVTFYGEHAQDMGGPRREYLYIILREMTDVKNNICKEDGDHLQLTQTGTNLARKAYYILGLLCGISLLQQGPTPSFFSLQQVVKLMEGKLLTEAEEQFSEGFNVLGLMDLMRAKPVLQDLLSTPQKAMTRRRLLALLKYEQAPPGSNRQIQEDRVYGIFVAYTREVAAGRRCNLSIGSLLRFFTGSECEPLLGFINQPTIVFVPDLPASIPQASTCISQLRLPIGDMVPEDRETLFDRFDMAFVNSFFGKM